MGVGDWAGVVVWVDLTGDGVPGWSQAWMGGWMITMVRMTAATNRMEITGRSTFRGTLFFNGRSFGIVPGFVKFCYIKKVNTAATSAENAARATTTSSQRRVIVLLIAW